MSPLALQKQTYQKLRKVQVKGLEIQGKTKELYEEKAAETGVEGGVLLALKTETLLQKRKK